MLVVAVDECYAIPYKAADESKDHNGISHFAVLQSALRPILCASTESASLLTDFGDL